jgi:hypothetical protein
MMLGNHRIMDPAALGIISNERLKGAIDEVRIWKGRRTADIIKDNMYARVKGDEPGLVAYYPMERNTRDEYKQIVSEGTLNDMIPVADGVTPETLTFYKADGNTTSAPTLSSANTAALKQAPQMEDVQFSFVASERQIKVNLEASPARIEGCNIYVTVKNVKDMNGNKAEPITWGVYVQQDNLRWEESEMAIEKKAGKKATFAATFENRSSENETWSLSGLPSWLTVNTEGGTLKPLSNGTLTFSIAESLPAGKYETTVYLTGKQNIAAPLTINVKSKGNEPLWSVNPNDYEESVNMIGELRILDMPSRDEDDIVAAFIDGE